MKTRIANRSVSLLLLFLYSFSQASLLISCIGCQIQPVFYLWLGLICFSTWLTTCTSNGMWIGLPLSAFLLFLASRYFSPDLGNQLNDVFDRLNGVYMEHVVYPGEVYPYLHAAEDHSLFFLFLLFLLSSYMGSAISSRSGRIGLSLLGSIPFFALCLVVTVNPPVFPIFGMTLFWFLLAVGGNHFDDTSFMYRGILISLLPLLLLLSLLLAIVNPNEYIHPPSEFNLSEELDRLVQNLDTWLNDRMSGQRLNNPDATPADTNPEIEDTMVPDQMLHSFWQDQQGRLDLTLRPDPEDLSRTFLRVRTSESGTLYLRAVSYGDYTGTGWLQSEEPNTSSSLDFTARALSAAGTPASTVNVLLQKNSAYRYYPYYCLEKDASDSFVPTRGSQSYSVNYYPFTGQTNSLSVPPSLYESEFEYRAFAYSYYTRLPESTLNALTGICETAGLNPGMDNLIQLVAQYVQQSVSYNSEAQPYPSVDYAIYFLQNAEEGYCVHYATAAAVLYRYLGIPARITEGFLVQAEAGEFTDVKGAQAHSWVEVYQAGLGWLPIEVTGHSNLDAEEPPPEDSTPPSSSGDPSSSQSSEPQATLPLGLVTQESSSSGTVSKHVNSILWAVLVVFLTLTALPFRRSVLLALRNRRFEQPDTRKAVIAMYRDAQKARPFGADLTAGIQSLAEKAAFSQHTISAQEVEAYRDQLYMLLKSTYLRLKPWDKFRFKYLSVLL